MSDTPSMAALRARCRRMGIRPARSKVATLDRIEFHEGLARNATRILHYRLKFVRDVRE